MANPRKNPPKALLGERFQRAFELAFRLHRSQTRKGKPEPYIGHLIAVAALVIEAGGDEDLAIAALLHDAVEDQGGKKTLARIRRAFGPRVAKIVVGCSDTDVMPKPPWRPRKEQYIEHIKSAPPEVRLVSAADKLHNTRSILADLRVAGPATLERFTGRKDGTLWYYRAMVTALRQAGSDPRIDPLVDELDRVVSELERLSGG